MMRGRAIQGFFKDVHDRAIIDWMVAGSRLSDRVKKRRMTTDNA